MRAQAFIDEPQRVLLFETIRYRDELLRTIIVLGTLCSDQAIEEAGRITNGGR